MLRVSCIRAACKSSACLLALTATCGGSAWAARLQRNKDYTWKNMRNLFTLQWQPANLSFLLA